MDALRAEDLYFDALDGTVVHALYIAMQPIRQAPLLYYFHGYSQSAGEATDYLPYLLLGYHVLAVDIRDQAGQTRDWHRYTTGAENTVTKGLNDPYEYSLRHIAVDCLLALRCVDSRCDTDTQRAVAYGASQGGGLAVLLSAVSKRFSVCFAEVPSGSDLKTRILSRSGMYTPISDYLRTHPHAIGQSFQTLSYFDTMFLAQWITCPVYATVGLQDTVCPASCFLKTYERISSTKQLVVYPLGTHESSRQDYRQALLLLLKDYAAPKP